MLMTIIKIYCDFFDMRAFYELGDVFEVCRNLSSHPRSSLTSIGSHSFCNNILIITRYVLCINEINNCVDSMDNVAFNFTCNIFIL